MNQPPLQIKSAAEMVNWLRDNLGTGPLAGMLRRGDDIVFCPRVGEEGYVALTDDERDNDGPAQVRPVDAGQIASFIQLTYWCRKKVKSKEDEQTRDVPAMFPAASARPAVDHPGMQPHLRGLRGVTHSPIPRANGTILDTPGYDPASRLLYLPAPGLVMEPVPNKPTAAEIAEALKLLRYMVEDFQFLSVHDEANYLGLLLTPLMRELTPPPYKLAAIGARQPGSGKSLLAGVMRILHGGVFRAEVPATEEEMRKAVTTILDVTTGPVVQLDNVTGVLRSSVLAGLLTSRTWEDRRLGTNSQMRGRNDRLWTITGNNLTLGGDLVRRTVWVTIDPGRPDPHLRTGFQIENLEQHAHQHRGELLRALLVLIRAWVVAKKPVERRGSDSYAAWIEATAGILAHAGHPGVFDHRDSARQSIGSDDADWREFLTAVHEQFEGCVWGVKDLLQKFEPRMQTGENGFPVEVPGPLALSVLPAELADKAARSCVGVSLIGKSLGRWLANRDGRWAGDLTVRRVGEQRGAATYRVEQYTRSGEPSGE